MPDRAFDGAALLISVPQSESFPNVADTLVKAGASVRSSAPRRMPRDPLYGLGRRPAPGTHRPLNQVGRPSLMSALPRPQPRPGVLDIEAYVPGKEHGARLSRAYSSFPPTKRRSARACKRSRPIAALPIAWRIIRTAPPRICARRSVARSAYDPARIVCGAGSDDLLNLFGARLSARRRRGDPHHARLSGLSHRHARHRGEAHRGAGKELHGRRRRDPWPRGRRAPSSCFSPIRTTRPVPTFRSTR